MGWGPGNAEFDHHLAPNFSLWVSSPVVRRQPRRFVPPTGKFLPSILLGVSLAFTAMELPLLRAGVAAAQAALNVKFESPVKKEESLSGAVKAEAPATPSPQAASCLQKLLRGLLPARQPSWKARILRRRRGRQSGQLAWPSSLGM